MSDDAPTPASGWSVPDKPALEGIEAALGHRRGRSRAPTGSTAPRPATRSTPSTPRRRRSAARCTSATSSATPTPTPSPATSACGARGLLPDGVGRQRPAHRAPGPELLRRPLRPVAPLRPRLRRPPGTSGPRTSSRRPVHISRRNFVELCDGLTAEDEKVFEDLWRTPRPVGRLVADLRHHRRAQPAGRPAGLPAQPGPGRGLPGRGARPLGRRLPPAVAQAELEDRELPGAYHRIPFAPRRRDGEPIFIETTRPELLAACVALVAHPDDERYQPLFGTTVRTPLFGVEVAVRPTSWPIPRRARASP